MVSGGFEPLALVDGKSETAPQQSWRLASKGRNWEMYAASAGAYPCILSGGGSQPLDLSGMCWALPSCQPEHLAVVVKAVLDPILVGR